MKAKIRKYIDVLKIELQDLAEDLRIMEELYNEREKRREITPYVFLENTALVMNEISGIESILHSLSTLSDAEYTSLEDFVADVDILFREKTMHSGFPEAVYALVKRKLEKVLRYVLSEDA